MKIILGLLLTIFTLPAFAGIHYYDSSDVSVGVFSQVKCGSGVTCSQSSGQLLMASSPTLVNALTLTAASSTAASITMQSNAAAANADTWKIDNSTADLLTFQNKTSGSLVAKVSVNTAGDVFGPGAGSMYGFLAKQVAATATTITASQCGSTFYNSGAVVINLPDGAAGLLGCRLTFFTANASNFDVNPGNSDQILVLTNAAGDAIRNATLGNTVVLQYGATNQWYEVSAVGTWSDIN